MDKVKANKILKSLTDLYNHNDITEDDFYTLSNDNKLLATLWCLIDTNIALDPINPRRTIIQSLSSVAQQHYRDINTDLVNKLNTKDYSDYLETIINKLNNTNNTTSSTSKNDYSNTLDIINTNLSNNKDVLTDILNDDKYLDILQSILTKLNTLTNDVDYSVILNNLNNNISNLDLPEVKDYTTNLNNIVTLLDVISKKSNDVNVTNKNLSTTFTNTSINVDNLDSLSKVTLNTKLQDNVFKLDTATLTSLINNVFTAKLDNSTLTDLKGIVYNTKLDASSITSIRDMLTAITLTSKLDATTLTSLTNLIKDILSTTSITSKIEDVTLTKLLSNTFITKLDSNSKIEVSNLKPTPVLINEGEIINSGATVSKEVSNYTVATYQVVTSSILGTAAISLQGSLDNINWCNLPITYCSGLNMNNNIVTVGSNGSTTISVNVITKYVRLNIVGNNTKNTVNLYLK